MLHDVILFDLDGTLSDPLEGIARSLNYRDPKWKVS
jgi:phosphoglycolate phosphatase-like HAD superfamily hydrolase